MLEGKVTFIDSPLDSENKNVLKGEVDTMEQYRCIVCGYIYVPEIGDPDQGISPRTNFGKLPDHWVCPECGAPKEQFEMI